MMERFVIISERFRQGAQKERKKDLKKLLRNEKSS